MAERRSFEPETDQPETGAASISRSSFLARAFGRDDAPVRPPWSLRENKFTQTCTACGDCIEACGENILLAGRASLPVVSFVNGECTFCGDCVAACPTTALGPVKDTSGEPLAPWSLKAHIEETCLALAGVVCRVCEDMCGEDAIFMRPEVGGRLIPQINETTCNGCGACVAPCPSQALSIFDAGVIHNEGESR